MTDPGSDPQAGGAEVRLANPRGFCAGVERAIEIVERALALHGAPVYVFHEIVHNRRVLDDLSSRGVVFVEDLDQVPEGAVAIFSAHGVSDSVEEHARRRNLRAIDATCPLVTKVHKQAIGFGEEGRDLVLIGHVGHPEVEGILGKAQGRVQVISTVAEANALRVRDPDKLAYVTQTTLSVDDTRDVIEVLQRRFPSIRGPQLKDICYATQNRQNAVRELLQDVQLLLVVGSRNSSNSNRLREMGERAGVPAHLVDGPEDVRPEWVAGVERVGLTAGASAPEELVREVLDRLRELGVQRVSELQGEPENTVFKMPPELARLGEPGR